MKISFSWIKQYLKTSLDINLIADILTSIGLEVESISNDILEVNITPNRSDVMSHYGLARYLYATLKIKKYDVTLIHPEISCINNIIETNHNKLNVIINNNHCIRYVGGIFSEIEILDSPNWLKDRLYSINITPINNIIDILNFVIYDLGQPLQVFDADNIIDNQILIQTTSQSTPFETPDNKNLILDKEDLIIFNHDRPISIAGIIVSKKYNINNNTKKIFLESACYSPEIIRSTSKRHGINTESSFRFSRGVDHNQVANAFKKTAILIHKILPIKKVYKIFDYYPNKITSLYINLKYNNLYKIIGSKISIKKIKTILIALEIEIINAKEDSLDLKIPTYRIDIQREIDIIEEILRMYGYNKIKISKIIKFPLKENNNNQEAIEDIFAQQLIAHGFYEIINLSFSQSNHNRRLTQRDIIHIINPLNHDINTLRSNLLESMLKSIYENIKRKNFNLKLFEFGKIYYKIDKTFFEKKRLGIIIINQENKFSFFYLKSLVQQLLHLSGISNYSQRHSTHFMMNENSLIIRYQGQDVAQIGKIKLNILKKMNLQQEVFFADIDYESINNFFLKKKKVQIQPLSKYPWVKRDLSMLVNKKILFEQISKLSIRTAKKYIKNIILFDVYYINNNQKAYGISFYLEDVNKTLTDQKIDLIIEKIKKNLIKKLSIKFR